LRRIKRNLAQGAGGSRVLDAGRSNRIESCHLAVPY